MEEGGAARDGVIDFLAGALGGEGGVPFATMSNRRSICLDRQNVGLKTCTLSEYRITFAGRRLNEKRIPPVPPVININGINCSISTLFQ